MGISIFRSSDDFSGTPKAFPNPNPENWSLISVRVFERHFILWVRYHDCTNYAGKKILVFKGEYKSQPKYLDPHFCNSSPNLIARFVPTEAGMRMAVTLCEMLEGFNPIVVNTCLFKGGGNQNE